MKHSLAASFTIGRLPYYFTWLFITYGALAAMRGIAVGETHFDIEQNVNPDRHNAKMRITRVAWREYKNLFNYSRTARYEGITDIATFEQLKQIDHTYCLKHLDNFKKYVQSQGLVM